MNKNTWINIVAAFVALVILALYLLNRITGEQFTQSFLVALPYIWYLLNERRKSRWNRNKHNHLNTKLPESDDDEKGS